MVIKMVETRMQKLNATKSVAPVITVVRYNLRPRPSASTTASAKPVVVVVRHGTLYYNLRPRK
jgi:hypothetical protein